MRRHAASRSAPSPSELLRLIRAACVACAFTIVASTLSGCGEDGRILDPGPATGAEYRRLAVDDRVAAARACRDAAAARTSGLAAQQIANVDPALLRTELDLAIADDRHVTFRAACAAAVPLVTPGLTFKFPVHRQRRLVCVPDAVGSPAHDPRRDRAGPGGRASLSLEGSSERRSR